MAVTLAIVKDYGNVSWGNLRASLYTVTLDSSYPTGGYAITAAQVALRTLYGIKALGGNTATAGYVPAWNTQTVKLQMFTQLGSGANLLVQSGTAGAGDALSLSSNNSGNAVLVGGANITANVTVPGALPAAPLSEVASTSDLHTLAFTVLFIGD